MSQVPSTPVDIQFPLAGIDRSLPSRRQPPLTTYDALNVRAFPPSSDRLGGGSREGFAKLIETQAGSAGSLRIQGLDVLTEANSITDPNQYSQVELDEDWTSQATGAPTDLGVNWAPVIRRSGRTTPLNDFEINSSDEIEVEGASNTVTMIASSYFVDDEVGIVATIQGNRQCTTTTSGFATANGPSNIGPFISASNDLSSSIQAYIRPTGVNEFEFRLYEPSDGGVGTSQVASAAFTLEGTTTESTYTITLSRLGDVVTGRLQATGVLSGGGDIDVSISYTTSLTGSRGGLFVKSGGNSSYPRRCSNITLTNLHPPAETVYVSIDPSVANPIDANRYYLPDGMIGVDRDASQNITLTGTGPTSSSNPNWPAIDDDDDNIDASNPPTGSGDYDQQVRWAQYNTQDIRYGVTMKISPADWADPQDHGSAVVRASADGRNALFLRISSVYDTDTDMVGVVSIEGMALVDNVATDLGFISNGPGHYFAIHHDELAYKVTDDGTSIRFYVNGVLLTEIQGSSFPNWTTEIGDALEPHKGVGFTTATNSGIGATISSEFGTVQIVRGEDPLPINVNNTKNKIAVYSAAKLQIADTDTLTLADVVGPVMKRPLPSSGSLNRKFYAVDGNDEIIIDPALLTSTDWAAAVTDGTLPAGMRHCKFFRGSAYVAASDSDPTIWYKSRTLNPLDWDFGADPQVSSAVAGNNGEVGQPADAITALITFSDDYLVFGMARSIGVLEGDPGYGGQFQIVSNEAGIVGPRAYCFDDRGNLYFVGAGGLYQMLKGSFAPEPVGPRKLRRALEEVDTKLNLIQLAFRPSDRTIRIFITPTDGETLGTHIVYDTRTEGFFFDQYPLGFGPWAVAQINGVLDIDRNLIIGCNDGYIRRPSDDAASDDGTAIASSVEIAVPEGEQGRIESMCEELQFVMGEGGGDVSWYWFVGQSPEQVRVQTVANADYVASGTLTGTGFLEPVGMRQTGASHKIVLAASSSTARWALERITAEMAVTTDRRR